jgi:hypothetical protein
VKEIERKLKVNRDGEKWFKRSRNVGFCRNPEEVYWSFSGSLWAKAVSVLLQVDLSLVLTEKRNTKTDMSDCTKYMKHRRNFSIL